MDLLDFEDEARLALALPGLVELLGHYQSEVDSNWCSRWQTDSISTRELRRLHAVAAGSGWLEISAGNPDAPEGLRQVARYRLTRAGKAILHSISQNIA